MVGGIDVGATVIPKFTTVLVFTAVDTGFVVVAVYPPGTVKVTVYVPLKRLIKV
jgi:hypothetical protein